MTATIAEAFGEVGPGLETADARALEVAVHALGLEGRLVLVEGAPGVVILPREGAGESPEFRCLLAEALGTAGLATLEIDLLTDAERRQGASYACSADRLGLLANRLLGVTEWLAQEPETWDLGVGYFGSGVTGAAEVLAAAKLPGAVQAVVLASGRPDLAGAALFYVRAPTLFVVAGGEPASLALNREALAALRCEKKLTILEDAPHLFDDEAMTERVAALAAGWFRRCLRRVGERRLQMFA